MNNLGAQDRSLSANAVTPPGGLTISKAVNGAPDGWNGATFSAHYDCGGSYVGDVSL